jgi:hypothetical protein
MRAFEYEPHPFYAPLVLQSGRKRYVPEFPDYEKARELALAQFIKQLGHLEMNIPIGADTRNAHYYRCFLRDFLTTGAKKDE